MARNNRLVEEFQNEFNIDTIAIEGLKNSYTLEDKTLFFIDSLWAEGFDFKKQKNLLVLTKNTEFNLEAILLQNDVDQIIADGSSYPCFKNRWEKHVTNSMSLLRHPKRRTVFTFRENEEHRFLGIFQNLLDLEKPYNLLA